jgi:hypothetical protein
MKKTSFVFLAVMSLVFVFHSCKKDVTTNDDVELFSELSKIGYSFYQGGNILPAAGSSPHGSFKLRFNDIAQTVLDSTGELPIGSSFPTGSVLVKEIYTGTNLDLYAVIQKKPLSSNSKNGWLWAEYNTDGSAIISLSENGSSCTSCHSQTQNRDFTLTFDLH